MAEAKYGKHIISNPRRLHVGELAYHERVKVRNAEGLVYLDKGLVPATHMSVIFIRIFSEPDSQPHIRAHKHNVDEALLFL